MDEKADRITRNAPEEWNAPEECLSLCTPSRGTSMCRSQAVTCRLYTVGRADTYVLRGEWRDGIGLSDLNNSYRSACRCDVVCACYKILLEHSPDCWLSRANHPR